MDLPIEAFINGRICRTKGNPAEGFPAMCWSQDMLISFTRVPRGVYQAVFRLQETRRVDAGGGDDQELTQYFFVNGVRVEAQVRQRQEGDRLVREAVLAGIGVERDGFRVRICASPNGMTTPTVTGFYLVARDDRVVYDYHCGDAQDAAMWAPCAMNPETGETRSTTYEGMLKSGVPLGGIGTGRVELFTNGTLGAFTTANNHDMPLFWPEGCFFALHSNVDPAGGRMLHPERHDGGYDMPGVDAVRYQGEYPRATLAYEMAAVPLSVTLHAAGTLVPGHASLSSVPGASFVFEVRNDGEAEAEVSLLMSMPNLCGQGGYNYLVQDRSSSCRATYESVEGAVQRPWSKVVGEGDDQSTLKGVLMGSERSAQDVREQNCMTEYLAFSEGEDVEHCAYNLLDPIPAFWSTFAESGYLVDTGVPAGRDGEVMPAAAVARRLVLAPGATGYVMFGLAWWHAAHYTFRHEVNHGHAYQQWMASIDEVAENLVLCREERSGKLDAFLGGLQQSSLPAWLVTKLINGAFPATTNSIWTNDEFFSIHESPTSMAGALGTNDQRLASQAYWFAVYPELDRLELDWFRRTQYADGRIPHMIGNLYDKMGCNDTHYCDEHWPDLACSYMVQAYHHYLHSGDVAALKVAYACFGPALDWMHSTDPDGSGLPVGGSTYDYDQDEASRQWPMIYNATLYLAALRIAMAAAERLGQSQDVERWQQWFDAGYATLMTRYWNGEWFAKWASEAERQDNCFVAQLAGDWALRLLGLEPLFPAAITDRVLDNIMRLNVRPWYPAAIMEATAEGANAAYVAYIQQTDVYLGMELIYRGRLTDAFDLLQRRQEMIWRVNANPWGEGLSVEVPSGVEANLQDYMTSTATWNVLPALTGLVFDAARQRLAFCPQMGTQRWVRYPVLVCGNLLSLEIDLRQKAPQLKISCVPFAAEAAVLPAFATVTVGGDSYEIPLEMQ